jgi:hypothetical protein
VRRVAVADPEIIAGSARHPTARSPRLPPELVAYCVIDSTMGLRNGAITL